MPDLNVTIIQTELAWQEIEENLSRMDARLDRIEGATDLVVLPEMFSSGFSMAAPQLAESMQGRAVQWMRAKAAALGADITGSLIIAEQGRYYNRLVWAKPEGAVQTYDKRHLFAYAGEERVYTAGQGRLVVELKGWRIRPFICYDLRFPIWCRNLDLVYDAALFVANWPAQRAPHWKTLLHARAIENQAYVIGVNRVGQDGRGLQHDGHSAIIAPTGEVLFEAVEVERSCTMELDRNLLERYRHEFPVWMDADEKLVVQDDPSHSKGEAEI
jgi:omega-amidase